VRGAKNNHGGGRRVTGHFVADGPTGAIEAIGAADADCGKSPSGMGLRFAASEVRSPEFTKINKNQTPIILGSESG
jgi:hypothetical protein